MERALETIARGSTPLETIRETAGTLVDSFAEDLGIRGGRVYARDDSGDYELVATFGEAAKSPIGLQVSRQYHPIERLLDECCVVMELSDTGLDRDLEAELGTRDQFAAIVVADGGYALSFDVVDPETNKEDLLATLNIVRLAINQKLREEAMLEVLEESRRIQNSILPRRIPSYGDFDLAARTVPAEIVGGDFYDFITLTDSVFNVVVADATGHGLPAALQVRDIYTGLRMGLSREFKLSRTLERLNQIIHRSRLATKFVSLFLAEIEVGGTVMYCNAGHPPAIVVRSGGDVELLRTGGPIIGPRPDAHYTVDIIHLLAGDLMVLYSDGITETRRRDTEEEFSPQRLIALARDLRDRSASAIVKAILEEVTTFSGGRPPDDDRTLVVVKRAHHAEEEQDS